MKEEKNETGNAVRHSVLQMRCLHAMAILSGVFLDILHKKQQKKNVVQHSQFVFSNIGRNKIGRQFMCVINFAKLFAIVNFEVSARFPLIRATSHTHTHTQ